MAFARGHVLGVPSGILFSVPKDVVHFRIIIGTGEEKLNVFFVFFANMSGIFNIFRFGRAGVMSLPHHTCTPPAPPPRVRLKS